MKKAAINYITVAILALVVVVITLLIVRDTIWNALVGSEVKCDGVCMAEEDLHTCENRDAALKGYGNCNEDEYCCPNNPFR